MVNPYTLYFDKDKISLGCMFPSQLSQMSESYMYNPQRSNIITKYEGKKWFFLFGKLKRSYKFRYYYYDKYDQIDTTKLMWYHDLYIDKKTMLPLVFDEAPVYTMYNESYYDCIENRRIQYRCDKKMK